MGETLLNIVVGCFQAGLSSIHFTAEKSNFYHALQYAEENAKQQKLKVKQHSGCFALRYSYLFLWLLPSLRQKMTMLLLFLVVCEQVSNVLCLMQMWANYEEPKAVVAVVEESERKCNYKKVIV